MVKITDVVTFVDATGVPHNALVTAVFEGAQGEETPPSVNVVYVSDDSAEHDQYGRQLAERVTSIVHKSSQSALSFFWRGTDER